MRKAILIVACVGACAVVMVTGVAIGMKIAASRQSVDAPTQEVYTVVETESTTVVETSSVQESTTEDDGLIVIYGDTEKVYVKEESFHSYQDFINDNGMQAAIQSILFDIPAEYDPYSFASEGLYCVVDLKPEYNRRVEVDGETGKITVSVIDEENETTAVDFGDAYEQFTCGSIVITLPMSMFESAEMFKANDDMKMLIGNFFNDMTYTFDYTDDMYFQINEPYVLVEAVWGEGICAVTFNLDKKIFTYTVEPAATFSRGGG